MASADDMSAPPFARQQPRILSAGLAIVALAVLVVFVITPFAKRWSEREAQIEAAQRQFNHLNALFINQAATNAMVTQREVSMSLQPTRVLRAKSRALAASALQSMVQDMAEASHITVTRLDIATVVAGTDVPLTLSANGDIYGLTDLLRQFRNSRYVVDVDKMLVQVNSALRGAPDVLQMTLSLHAPVIVE